MITISKEMGTLCGFGNINTRRSSKLEDSEDRSSGLTKSAIKFMKRKCSWRTKKKTKKQLHPQEKKVKQQPSKSNRRQFVTLEEWIISSPWHGGSSSTEAEGDHIHVSTQVSSSKYKWVHPSFDGNINIESSSIKSNGSFRLDGLTKLEDINRREVEDSLICHSRNHSGKMKKVSFRLPEVADVFILDSPEAHFESEECVERITLTISNIPTN